MSSSFASNPVGGIVGGIVTTLEIGEIERLAKAGVVVTLTPITPQSDAAPTWPPSAQSRIYPMVDAFWERWRRANPHHGRDYSFDNNEDFNLFAIETGGKVQVLVADKDRFVVIEDLTYLYPSDALMAAIHLWRQTK